jgi:hypothetical protein
MAVDNSTAIAARSAAASATFLDKFVFFFGGH